MLPKKIVQKCYHVEFWFENNGFKWNYFWVIKGKCMSYKVYHSFNVERSIQADLENKYSDKPFPLEGMTLADIKWKVKQIK